MGRVARYKKVKSVARHHSGGEYIWGSNNGRSSTKKKRSQIAEKLKEKKLKRKHKNGFDGVDDSGYDLPPSGKDEFDLSDPDFKVKKVKTQSVIKDDISSSMGSKSTSKTTTTPVPSATITTGNQVKIGNTIVSCTIPKDDVEERRAAKSLLVDTKSGKSKSENTNTIKKRQEGESMRAFNRRLREQTRLALAQDLKQRASNIDINKSGDGDGQPTGKKEKRKEYMKLKKLKKKKGVENVDESATEENEFHQGDHNSLTDQNDDSVLPSFLDQVEAPPSFNQLPRHAKKKKSTDKKHVGMDEKSIKAEQDAMEAMRRKIQAQYSIIKAKRRQEGSFHL